MPHTLSRTGAPPRPARPRAPIVASALALAVAAGAATAQTPATPPSAQAAAGAAEGPAAARAAKFDSLDLNSDRRLSGVELLLCRCRSLDANRDRRVTLEEFIGTATAGSAGSAATTGATAGASPTPTPTPAPAPPAAATAPAAPAASPAPAPRSAPAPMPTPASAATPAPTSAPAPLGAVHTPWPAMDRFGAGERVRFRTAGNLWSEGTIKQVGPDPQSPIATVGMFLVDGEGWQDRHTVAGTEREPFWTGYFLGDWQVAVPMAVNTRVVGNDVYRVFSGGMLLPPLRVNADGTYQWRVYGNGGERTIAGRWEPRPDAPGIILRDGEDGADWTVYNATDKSTLAAFGRAVIHLTAEGRTYQEARRLSLDPVTAVHVGDKVVVVAPNGGMSYETVTEVSGSRVKVRNPWNMDSWTTVAQLRRPEQ